MFRFSLTNSIFQSVALDQFGGLRSDTLCLWNLNNGELLTVGIDGGSQILVIGGLEEILIIHLECTVYSIEIVNPDVLMIILNLISVRIQTTVGSNDAIAVEVVVAGRIATVVATIGEDFLTGDGALVAQTLIYKVPDVTTLVFWILADEIPILLETSL